MNWQWTELKLKMQVCAVVWIGTNGTCHDCEGELCLVVLDGLCYRRCWSDSREVIRDLYFGMFFIRSVFCLSLRPYRSNILRFNCTNLIFCSKLSERE